jgi:putative flavoprotein involved in K+ transport
MNSPLINVRVFSVNATRSTDNDARMLDVLVIGAGQAGLATGYHLCATGFRYEIVDRHARVGESWRRRYDSLTLFTPRTYSALPGLAVPGDPDGYPTKDEIADYLESYARRFDLPVRLNAGARSLERDGDAFRAALTDGSVVEARAVVLASGAFQTPSIPAVAAGFAPAVAQLSAASYRHPAGVPAGTVLVVGDGATGRHIARELAPTHRVLLATGRPRRPTPARVLGRSIFWWLDRLGVLRASRESRIGRRMMATDPFPGRDLDLPRLRRAGVTVVPRLVAAEGTTARFADDSDAEVSAVIWATGYRTDSAWIDIPGATGPDGGFLHTRGVSPVPGLYVVGQPWQWTRGSALLLGVGDDAAYVTAQVACRLSQSGVGRCPPEVADLLVRGLRGVGAGRPAA